MKLKITLILISIISFTSVSAAPIRTPRDELNSTNRPYRIIRFFKRLSDNKSLMAEFKLRLDGDREVNGLKLSFRKKFNRFIGTGIWIDRVKGERHDDDWVKEPAPSIEWSWNKANKYEVGSGAFIRYKDILSFLGDNWIGELKLNAHANWDRSLYSIKPEFTLTYVYFEGTKAIVNLYTKYTAYLPMNYSTKALYANWIYFGAMFHTSKNVKPFIFYAINQETWTDSKTSLEFDSSIHYQAKSRITYLGAGVNIYLP